MNTRPTPVTRLPNRGPRWWVALAAVVGSLTVLMAVAVIGRTAPPSLHPAPALAVASGPPAAVVPVERGEPTAVASPEPPLAAPWAWLPPTVAATEVPASGCSQGAPYKLLAVSASEVWTGPDGLCHYQAGHWSAVSVASWDVPQVRSLARGRDGTLAVATDHGAAVLRGDRWTVLESGKTDAVTVAPDGTIWVARPPAGPADPDVPSAIVSSFRFHDGRWWRAELPPVRYPGGVSTLLVDTSGGLWLGSAGYLGSLEYFDGTRWIDELREQSDFPIPLGLSLGPDGAVWAVVTLPGADGAGGRWVLARHDRARWTLFDWCRGDCGVLLGPVVFARDGAPIIGTLGGLVRFDPTSSTFRPTEAPVPKGNLGVIAQAPDGTIWGWSEGTGLSVLVEPST